MKHPVSAKEISEIFGRRLRAARKEGLLTQEQLADAVSMSVDMIGRLERGTAQPSFETLARLCRALGVDVAFLFGGDGDALSTTSSAQTRRLIDRIRMMSVDDVDRAAKAIDLIVR